MPVFSLRRVRRTASRWVAGDGIAMSPRRLPLTKLFPNKVVARMKIWFPTWSVGMEGPIAPELARLIVAVYCGKQDPALLARLDAIATELRDRGDKPAKRSDRSIRQELTTKRRAGVIGRTR
jgi:hypothetical protein